MEVATIICIIIAILALILIGFFSIYNRFQDHLIRINEVESNIDNTLRKKFDLLSKSKAIVENKLPDLENPLKIVEELHSKKMSNFELDRALEEAIIEFESYKSKIKDKEYDKIVTLLSETEAELIAYRKYYNDVTTDYNRLRHRIPTNLVALVCGYKDRNYYDNKNIAKENDNLKL